MKPEMLGTPFKRRGMQKRARAKRRSQTRQIQVHLRRNRRRRRSVGVAQIYVVLRYEEAETVWGSVRGTLAMAGHVCRR